MIDEKYHVIVLKSERLSLLNDMIGEFRFNGYTLCTVYTEDGRVIW